MMPANTAPRARAAEGGLGAEFCPRQGQLPAPSAPAKETSGRRAVLAVTAVVLGCAVAAAALTFSARGGDGHTVGQWRTVFTGQGHVTGTTPGRTILLSPARATAPGVTHAALAVSARSYRDFTATVTVRTLRQLRHGAAGAPHPWEVGWVLWHFTGSSHFYALTLEVRGWVLSKQDPAYRGDERFLASGRTPGFPVGRAHQVQITQVGPVMTIRADGHLLTRFTDTQRPYLTGALGLYCEDSLAQFRAIGIRQLT
jgi:hypothetical protein